MPCSRARLTPSSGLTPTATATPRPCWTPTAGSGPPCPAAAAGRGPGPRRAGLGAGGDWVLWGGADPVSGRPWRVGDRDRPAQGPRGRHGAKSDALDAIRAGREALARDHLTSPRQRGHREALRVLHTTRAGVVAAGADARRQLKAPIVSPPPSRCGTACGGGPGASRSRPAPGLWPCLVVRWSTAPPCRRSA